MTIEEQASKAGKNFGIHAADDRHARAQAVQERRLLPQDFEPMFENEAIPQHHGHKPGYFVERRKNCGQLWSVSFFC